MLIWQLLQVEHLRNVPLIRMWPGLVEWARTTMLSTDPPLADAADMDIPRCVPTADEAIAIFREHHERWRRAGEVVGGPPVCVHAREFVVRQHLSHRHLL